MHSLLDDWAHSNALSDVSARLKLLLALGSIILCVSSASPITSIFVAVTMSLVVVIAARIPVRFFSGLLLLPLSFAILSATVVAFMNGTGDPIFSASAFGLDLGIREEGARLAILLVARTFGGMCSLFFLALTTPMIELFSVPKSLKIPDSVIELSMMIYRYIFVFLDQTVMIRNAQAMRLGDASLRSSLNSFAMLASVLFVRAWEQGERVMVAMDSRCYAGLLNLMEYEERAEPEEVLAVLGYLATVAAIAFLTRDFQVL